MELKDWTEFCILWNDGVGAKQLAGKFGVSIATIRNWVVKLRKQGVNLDRRSKDYRDINVDALNAEIRKAKIRRAAGA